jgi:hypothetical protein
LTNLFSRSATLQAEKCFRLAQGPVSFTLAAKLEAIGPAFERQAQEIEYQVPSLAA